MAENPRFDLNEALKYYLSDPLTVPTTEAASQLTDYENDPSSLEPDIVNSELDSITESVSDAVESILRPSIFDSLQLMLK